MALVMLRMASLFTFSNEQGRERFKRRSDDINLAIKA
jgi:hypothetical protein